MMIKDIDKYAIKSRQALNDNRIMDCFVAMSPLLKELQEWWAINRKEELYGLYSQMVRYLLKGVVDPQQTAVYNRFKNDIFILLDDIVDALKTRNSSAFQYQCKRFLSLAPEMKLADKLQILETYERYRAVDSEVESAQVVNDNMKELRKDYEKALNDVFEYFWLMGRGSEEDLLWIQELINNDKISALPKELFISAISLSILREFDSAKFEWLLEVSKHPQSELNLRAKVSLLLVLNRYSERIKLIPNLVEQLEQLSQDELYCEELENCFLQIVRTSETESISKRVKEELIPEMMKLGPRLKDKLQSDYKDYNDEMEKKNPEWESILDDNGVSDKIREFGDLQMQGADIYVSTFAPLKSYPFFSSVSSWFMPFDVENSHISGLFQTNTSLFNAFVKSPFLCNSDKYSFCLSLAQMPEMQQNLMGDAFKQETEQMNEMLADSKMLEQKVFNKNISNQYIQDLYRFYTLHPQHFDFDNPLIESLSFYKSRWFLLLFQSVVRRKHISEFYFSKNLYIESLDQFLTINDAGQADASTYQKIGYCYQQLHKYDKALKYYKNAELLDASNKWTLARIGFCYRSLSNYQAALEVYQSMESKYPDDYSYQYSAASCLYELCRYEEALAIYFKLNYFKPDSPSIWRLIAWCSFLVGKKDQAKQYYQKVLDNNPEPTDYLNVGHVAWSEHNLTLAHHYYQTCMELLGGIEPFKELFMNDVSILESMGIDEWSIKLMFDALQLYKGETHF